MVISIFCHIRTSIVFSGNGQSKYKGNFKYENKILNNVDRQTYLGLEMTSSGHYTYPREILSKKAYEVQTAIKSFLSYSDTTAISVKNNLFDAFVKPILLYGCEIWGPEILSYKPHFAKSRIAQVHIKFCKEALNTLWCTQKKACRAELGRYPLGTDIKASIWQRLKHTAKNSLLCEAFQFAANYSKQVSDCFESVKIL